MKFGENNNSLYIYIYIYIYIFVLFIFYFSECNTNDNAGINEHLFLLQFAVVINEMHCGDMP